MLKKNTIRNQFIRFNIQHMILIIVVLVAVASIVYKNTVEENAKSIQDKETEIIGKSIELIIESLDDYLLTLSVDSVMQEILQENPTMPTSIDAQYSLQKEYLKSIYPKSAMNDYVDVVSIVMQDGNVLASDNYTERAIQELLEREQIVLDKEQNIPKWYGALKYEHDLLGEKNVFLVTKPIYSVEASRFLGHLIFTVDEKKIGEMYANTATVESEIYLINESQIIISSNNKSLIGEQVNIVDPSNYIISTQTLNNNQWSVIKIVDDDFIGRDIIKNSIIIILIGIIVLIITIWNSYTVAEKVTKPVKVLIGRMNHFTEENENKYKEIKDTPEEIIVLNQTYQELKIRIQELLEKIQRQNEEKRQYELKILQEQIKPHFLYNSFETIISLVGIKKYDKAQQYTKSLGEFYKLSLNQGSDVIPINGELKLTEEYLYLQSIRYMNQMEYEIIIECDISNCTIPKLSLQPIVENAIYHGIKPKGTKCKIIIQCQKFSVQKDEYIKISVKDTGIGMSEEQIRSIKSNQKQENENFGLFSIEKRLKISFGELASLDIESEEGKYTIVYLYLPISGGV